MSQLINTVSRMNVSTFIMIDREVTFFKRLKTKSMYLFCSSFVVFIIVFEINLLPYYPVKRKIEIRKKTIKQYLGN